MAEEEISFTVGSGNVFADLGLPDAAELLAKSKVLHSITRALEERGLKKAEEQAKFLEMPVGRWQKMRRGRLLRGITLAEYQALQVKATRI